MPVFKPKHRLLWPNRGIWCLWSQVQDPIRMPKMVHNKVRVVDSALPHLVRTPANGLHGAWVGWIGMVSKVRLLGV